MVLYKHIFIKELQQMINVNAIVKMTKYTGITNVLKLKKLNITLSDGSNVDITLDLNAYESFLTNSDVVLIV